ncbi:hypothetical protein [Lacticaseibacillus sp. N501-2]|uniref:hypothetical protein n=1 Tax=Lacticaseibacillus salsurae TaxID=3367729 RepID=UPI0038B26ECD
MTDLERIEDMYPELRFWGIEVESIHYHGHIQGRDVYINTLQPDPGLFIEFQKSSAIP